MICYPVSVVLIFLCFVHTCAASNSSPTKFGDDVSVNCGSTGISTARNGRKWIGDAQPEISSFLRIKGTSSSSTVMGKLTPADDPVPHKIARLSPSQFSYSFQVSPGQKILRFHFNPAVYKGFKNFEDFFTVEAGCFTLLSNFSASRTAEDLGLSSFVKEYCINIEENRDLDIVFSTVKKSARGTYAFVNGIEIISVPLVLSYFSGVGNVGVQLIGKSAVYVDSSTALEMIHRQSIKQDSLSLAGDIRDLFGKLETVPKRKATKIRNITSKIPVDVGFRYLVRLHFSNLIVKIAEVNGLIYQVQINDVIVDVDIDGIRERGDENSIPWYRDYMVIMKGGKQNGKHDLLICLISNVEVMDGQEPFQGFEVMKLSNLENSLALPNPLPVAQSVRGSSQNTHQIRYYINMIVSVAISLLLLINITFHMLLEKKGSIVEYEENMHSIRAQRHFQQFSLAEIQLATGNFSDKLVIGKGGFGNVYKGLIDNGRETVAIKRLQSNSSQGAPEFFTEIETLTQLRHANLVSLIGYCSGNDEMMLVYEYMSNGALTDHINETHLSKKIDRISLTWKQRLSICIGVGRGLDYIHSQSLIHRDVKSSNILLDENLVAKITDFGLAKYLHGAERSSQISTKVMGTIGYLDPSYFTTGRLTAKSDTYGLGVVLLEVLCGRRVVVVEAEENERMLTVWALENISKGNADQIVASTIRSEVSEDSLKTYLRIVEGCLNTNPLKRPNMAEVVQQLESALELQEISESVPTRQVNYKFAQTNLWDEQTNTELPSGREDGTKSTTHLLSRLRPFGAFRKRVRPTSNSAGNGATETANKNKQIVKMVPSSVQIIPVDELKDITDHFSSKCLMGKGSCGRVYHGILKSGQAVAIKNFDFINQTEEEFLAQVSVVSSLKHENMVELLGYCVDGSLKCLAYERASVGTLHEILHGIDGTANAPVLSWAQRAKISVEAAEGLNYIHQKGQIHLAIKSNNILLFEDNATKIADFGLANLAADLTERLSSTFHFRTIGYHAPEYLMAVKLSWRNDVYSFGVVLLELLTGRKSFDNRRPTEQGSLATWAKAIISEGKVKEIVDARLEGNYPPNAAEKMAEIAGLCVQNEAKARPKMSVVVKRLRSLLEGGSNSETRNF